jgi:hypothetical protein
MPSSSNTIPSLRLRKDIWTHFPVCLVKQPVHSDGRDRYAIQWHQKNLTEWSQGIPKYTIVTHCRLLRALSTSDKWDIEEPRNQGDLAIIAMKFSDKPREFDQMPNLFDNHHTIRTVEDIKTNFPICWKTRKNGYVLEFHNTMVRAMADRWGVSEKEIREKTLVKLRESLEGSCEWSLSPPAKTQTCEIGILQKNNAVVHV